MIMEDTEHKTINNHKFYGAAAKFAAIDVDRRSCEAKNNNSLFSDPDHVLKVKMVQDIVRSFFPVMKNMYVNHRENRGKSFTVVKVEQPNFPNHLSAEKRKKIYRQPLEDLGVEIVFSKRSNSYLYRVF